MVNLTLLKREIVLSESLGHKRNHVEAALCHGAIRLAGGDGTLSEAIFTLSLGKPVTFRNEGWAKQLRLPEQSVVLAERACEKVWTEGSPDFQTALGVWAAEEKAVKNGRFRGFLTPCPHRTSAT